MKKLFLSLAFIALTMSVSAASIRYFTYSQAQRTIQHLDAQTELMIYCGYEDEIETYVLVNEVWAERVNTQFYEIWLYGFDAYTGDEIYMPLDLGCVWLYNRTGTRMYSAATTLRFRHARPLPTFRWAMPPYRPFARRCHAPGFLYTYHYDVHQPGWHHPYDGHNPHNYHPYYMRRRSDPMPVHREPYTPGLEMPRTMTADGHGYLGNTRGGRPTVTSGNPTQFATSSTASTRRTTGNTANPNTIVTSASSSRQAATTNSGTSTRSSSTTNSSTSSRSSATTNSGTSTRGSSSSNISTSTRSSATTNSGTSTRGSSTSSTSTSTRSSATTNSGTSTRGTSTSSQNTGSRSSSSTNQSSSSSRSSSSGTTTSSRQTSSQSGTSTRSSSSSTNNSKRR